jgi:hypothetical protein
MRWRRTKGRFHPCPSTLAKQRNAITRVLFPKWQIQQPEIAKDASRMVPHWSQRPIKNAGRLEDKMTLKKMLRPTEAMPA